MSQDCPLATPPTSSSNAAVPVINVCNNEPAGSPDGDTSECKLKSAGKDSRKVSRNNTKKSKAGFNSHRGSDTVESTAAPSCDYTPSARNSATDESEGPIQRHMKNFRMPSELNVVGSNRKVSARSKTSVGTYSPRGRKSMGLRSQLIYLDKPAVSRKPIEPTYHMQPKTDKEKFSPKQAEKVIMELLEEKLQGITYHPDRAARLALNLADKLKQMLKIQGWSQRYKYVTWVLIGQQKDKHSLQVTSRCLWNDNLDNYASVSYKQEDLFVVGVVFAMYHE